MEKHSSKRGSSATGKTEEVVSAPKPKKQKIDEAKWNETIDEIAEIFSSKCKIVEIITTSNHLLLLLLFGYVLYLSYLFIFFFEVLHQTYKMSSRSSMKRFNSLWKQRPQFSKQTQTESMNWKLP